MANTNNVLIPELSAEESRHFMEIDPSSEMVSARQPDDLQRMVSETKQELDAEKLKNGQLLQELQGAKASLEELQNYCSKVHAETEEKERTLQDTLRQGQLQLEKKDQDINDFRKRWKQAAGQLNNFKAQGQGFSPVTDQELVQKVRQLRFNIRNFAVQHFGGKVADSEGIDRLWKTVDRYVKMPPRHFDANMESSTKRPMIIEAYLWPS